MFQRIYDIDCNRCHASYKSGERGVLSVLFNNCYFSICPKCSTEVAAIMGFTPEELSKQMGLIKEAETENNRIKRKEDGSVCNACDKRFKEGDARVRESNSSNVESWHIDCYA